MNPQTPLQVAWVIAGFASRILAVSALITVVDTRGETLLYDLDFEQEAVGAVPAAPSSTVSGSGRVAVDSVEGSKVLGIRGDHVELRLPLAKLEKYNRGHQNPTLVTFNLRVDRSSEITLGNQSDQNPFVFARIQRGGAVFDGAESPGSDSQPRGSIREGVWHQVYLNYDPEWKGYYLSVTGPSGEKVEFRRRLQDPSYDFRLVVTVAAGSGLVQVDNVRGVTGFIRKNENRRSQDAEPVLFETVLRLSPGTPDLDVKRGTRDHTLKMPVAPGVVNGVLFVPVKPVLASLTTEAVWEESSNTLQVRRNQEIITLGGGASQSLSNASDRFVSPSVRSEQGSALVPLAWLAERLGLTVDATSDPRRVRITEPGRRYVESAETKSRRPADLEPIIVGAEPPREPRTPLALTYSLRDPARKAGDLAWSEIGYEEGPEWVAAASFGDIEKEMIARQASEVWIRFRATPTPETFSGTYFTAWHDGVLHTYNNGALLRAGVRGAGNRWLRFFNYITRNDRPGAPCQYGLRYQANRIPRLDVALVTERLKKSTVVPRLRNAGTNVSTFKPVLNISHIRDSRVIRGSDGFYYALGTPLLHGSIPFAEGINDGIELFRSRSRSGPFESVGYVWTFDRAGWANTRYFSADQQRNIWAPELAEINGKWYLSYFPTSFPKNGLGGYSVFQIGIAVADNPLGPYVDTGAFPIIGHPDPHLFQDDDGSVYLTCGNGYIARLKPGMDAIAEAPRFIYPKNGHSIFNEGSTLVKVDGRYFFGGAFSTFYYDERGEKRLEQSYDCVMASANHIYGPYGERFIGLKNGGNNSFFREPDGRWYASIWQPDKITGIVQVEKLSDDTWAPVADFEETPSGIRY